MADLEPVADTEKISAGNDRMSETRTAVNALTADLAAANGAIADNAAQIAAVKSTAAANKSDIAAVEKTANANKAELARASASPDEGQLFQAGANGRINVGTPTSSYNATTKAYVDGKISAAVSDIDLSDYLKKSGGTVSGTLRVEGGFYVPNSSAASSGYTVAYINGDGRLARGASSIRYKEAVRAWEADPARVLDLEPVRFRWRDEFGGGEDFGMIAEQVAEVFPELVHHNDEGQIEGIHYDRVAVLILPLLRDLAARVAALEGES